MCLLLLLLMGAQESKGLSPPFESRPLVCVCGSTNVDLIVSQGPRFPKKGETIAFKAFEQCFGGKGANQAVQAALAGARTEMVAKVGSDDFGEQMVSNLRGRGVGANGVTRAKDVPSGCALITVAENTNTIVIVPGANGALCSKDIDKNLLGKASVLLLQLEVPDEANLAALQSAPDALKILNTAPTTGTVNVDLLKEADVICANEVELSLLCDDMPCDDITQSIAAARYLLSCLPEKKIILATLGATGSLVVYDNRDSSSFKEEEKVPLENNFPAIFVAAERHVPVVDTTGAGDSFLGAFAAFIASGQPFISAVRDASKVAALSIQKPSTQPSYPTVDDLIRHYPSVFAKKEDDSLLHKLPDLDFPDDNNNNVFALSPDGTTLLPFVAD